MLPTIANEDEYHRSPLLECCTPIARASSSRPYRHFANRQDNMDGTYLVTYTPACAGEYRVSVEFLGTFQVQYLLTVRSDFER